MGKYDFTRTTKNNLESLDLIQKIKDMKKDNLGDRMKENYENRAKTQLLRRTPVIIRLDGKAFHTFTKGFE